MATAIGLLAAAALIGLGYATARRRRRDAERLERRLGGLRE